MSLSVITDTLWMQLSYHKEAVVFCGTVKSYAQIGLQTLAE